MHSNILFQGMIEGIESLGAKFVKLSGEHVYFDIPKGCKKYVFKESFGTLEVIAMNEKSAMKKYNKWCAANSQGVV